VIRLKILITGASSLPGYRVTLEALRRRYEVVGLYHTHQIPIEDEKLKKVLIDISQLDNLRRLIIEEDPDIIIHMAALGDVDLCEKDKELAWKTTVEPSMEIASIASRIGCFTVYLSTDYVFDGERGDYREYDTPNPVNYYGLTKLMGEIAFRSSCLSYAIVRASSIYGFGPGRMNFAKYLVEKLKAGETVKALIDQYTSPTQATLLGRAVIEIAEEKMKGIFHIVGERMSRYEFAVKVADVLGLDKSLIQTAEMKEMKWLAKRPRDSSLNYDETKRRIKTNFYSTEIALKVLKEELS
jgi:dTDP-4-dehydrorhamnose reductase